MRVYLSAKFERKAEMAELANTLTRAGCSCTSRWATRPMIEWETAATSMAKEAVEDLADLAASDVLVTFTEGPGKEPGTGGRHTELGVALILQKPVIMCGPAEQVFHYHPAVIWTKSWEEAMVALTTLAKWKGH